MSSTIDEKVVEMKFDNKDFESNVKTSMSTLEKLKSALNFKGASDGLNDLSSAIGKIDTSSLTSSVNNSKLSFSALEVVAMTALSKITSQAIDCGEQLVKSLSVDNISAGWEKFSQKTQSVGTLLAQGYDLDTVNEQLDRLNWYTDETSYNFTDMVENIAKFTASGQDLETSVTAMEGIANWAALSGQNATTASQAMYQLSQAMSAGYMRLEDYKSVQNASMDTEEFRQKCLDAGVALGTLQQNADGTYQSLVDGASSSAFTLSSFTTELTKGCWLTSDVMMEVFNDYSAAVDDIYEYAEEKGITASEAIEELGDDVDEFGLKAFKAAQEARSWADVVDSVKDAVSTGFMNTFEIIFGDYEQATELWTDLANALYDVFAEPINGMNELLGEALGSNWDSLVEKTEEVGIDTETFQNALIETAKSYGIAVDDIIEETGSFEDSIDQWLTGDIVRETLNNIADGIDGVTESTEVSEETLQEYHNIVDQVINGDYGNGQARIEALTAAGWDYATVQGLVNKQIYDGSFSIEDLSDSELENIGYTEEEIAAIRELADSAGDADSELSDLLDRINKPSGRDLLVDSFWNLWNSISAVTGIIKSAWSNIFPATTADQIYNVLEKINTLTTNLYNTLQGGDLTVINEIGRTFQGLFSILDIGKTVVTTLASKAFGILKTILGSCNIDILAITANIGDALYAFRNWVKQNDVINIALDKVVSIIEKAIEFIGQLIDKVKNLEVVQNIVSKFCTTFKDGLTNLVDRFPNVKEKIENLLKSVKSLNDLKLTDVLDVLKNFKKDLTSNITSVVDTVVKKFPQTIQKIKELIDNFKNLDGISFSGILGVIKSFGSEVITNLGDAISKIGDFISNVISALSGTESTETTLESVGSALGTFGDTMTTVGESIDSVETPVSNFVDAIGKLKEIVAPALETVQEKLNGLNLGSLAALAFCAVYIFVFVKAIKSLETAAKKLTDIFSGGIGSVTGVLNSVKDMFSSFAGAGKQLTSTLKSMQTSIKADTIKNIVLALSLLVGEMIIIAKTMSKEELATGIVAMGAMIGEVVALMAAVKLLGSANVGKGSMTALVAMSASLLVLIVALKKLEDVNIVGIIPQLVLLISLIAVLTTVQIVMSKFGGKTTATVGTALTLISFAASLLILINALKKLADANLSGIAGKMVVLAGVIAAMAVVMKSASKVKLSSAAVLISAAVSIRLLIGTIDAICNIDTASIKANLANFIIILGALASLMLISKLAGKNAAKGGVALLAMSAALLTMAIVMELMGAMAGDADKANQAIKVIAELMALFALLMVATIAAGKNAAKAGVAILLMSAAMVMLAGVIAVLTNFVDLDKIDTAVNAILKLETMFGVLMVLSKFASASSSVSLVIITAAVVALAAVVAALSMIDEEQLQNASTCLTMVMGVFDLLVVALGHAGKFSASSLIGFVMMAAVVAEIGAILYALCNFGSTDGALKAAAGISLVLGTLAASVLVLGKIDKVSGTTMATVAILAGVVAVIGTVIGVLCTISNVDQALSVAESLSLTLVALAGVTLVLSTIKSANALPGIAALGEVIGAVTTVLVAAGALSQIPGLNWLISEGSTLLNSVGEAIGSFVGSIITGFGEGVTSGLPEIGTNLSDFMDNASGFFDGLSGVNSDLIDAASTLVDLILTLTEANLIDSVGSFVSKFLGGNDLEGFVEELNDFIPGLVSVMTTLSGANIDKKGIVKVKSLCQAATALTEFADSIPNSGGALGVLFGNNDVGDFGTQLESFTGPFVTCMEKLSKAVVTPSHVEAVCEAGQSLTAFAKTVPNEGGVLGVLAGNNNLDDFGSQVDSFAGPFVYCLEKLSKAVVTPSHVEAVCEAGQSLTTFAKTVPTEGGLIGRVFGGKSVGTFGEQLDAFSGPFVRCLESLSSADVDAGKISTFTEAATAMSTLSEVDLSSVGNVSSFGSALEAFGTSLSNCYNSISGINMDTLNSAMTAAANLYASAGNSNVGQSMDTSIATSITDNSSTVSEAAVSVTTEATDAAATAGETGGEGVGTKILKGIKNLCNNGKETVETAASDLGDTISETLSNTDLIESGKSLVSSLTSGMSIDLSSITDATDLISTVGTDNLSSYLSDYSDLGTDDIEAYVEGLEDGSVSLDDFYSLLGESQSEALDDLTEDAEESGEESGEAYTEGFAEAVDEATDTASSAVDDLISAMNDRDSDFVDVGEGYVTNLVDGINNQKSEINTAFTKALSDAITAISGKNSDFKDAGSSLAKNLASGVSSQSSGISSAFTSALSSAVSSARSYYSSFYSAGSYLVQGFANGISSNTYMAKAKAQAMASSAADAAKKTLAERSPSKVFYKIGDFAGQGFVNALIKYASIAFNAGSDMAESAKEGLQNTASEIADVIDTGIDLSPTIRPVLDLDDVRSGVNSIGDLLASNQSLSLAMDSVGSIQTSMRELQNDDSSGELLTAIRGLSHSLNNQKGDTYQINGVTYDDGSNVSTAVKQLIHAANIARRV